MLQHTYLDRTPPPNTIAIRRHGTAADQSPFNLFFLRCARSLSLTAVRAERKGQINFLFTEPGTYAYGCGSVRVRRHHTTGFFCGDERTADFSFSLTAELKKGRAIRPCPIRFDGQCVCANLALQRAAIRAQCHSAAAACTMLRPAGRGGGPPGRCRRRGRGRDGSRSSGGDARERTAPGQARRASESAAAAPPLRHGGVGRGPTRRRRLGAALARARPRPRPRPHRSRSVLSWHATARGAASRFATPRGPPQRQWRPCRPPGRRRRLRRRVRSAVVRARPEWHSLHIDRF
jgi:hypothetical protein